MSANLLILHPPDPWAEPPDSGELIAGLQQSGLLGQAMEFEGQEHYRPGERFLEQIVFLGCSPVVALGEPGATGEEFCHIELVQTGTEPEFIGGDNVKPPRCPGCSYRIEEWPSLIDDWRRDRRGYIWRCPMCGREYSPLELNWRKCAGFSRVFLKIWGVFESEAIPSDGLRDTLQALSGQRWKHFYYRKS